MTKATGSFEVTSMAEDPYEELDGGIKLTHASGAQRFTGDIEGDGAVHWLMLYRTDKTARFVGLQRITGSVAGRRGTFVLTAEGLDVVADAFDQESGWGYLHFLVRDHT